MEKKSIAFAVLFFLMFALFNQECMGTEMKSKEESMNGANNTIFPIGEKGPADYFTGRTWVNMLVKDENNVYNTQAYDVRFEPRARTKWHSHPGGQLLFVTGGKGCYQEKGKPARLLSKGDVVEISPDVVHWHGAASDKEFTHLGVSTRTQDGSAEWFGEVTEEEYNAALKVK